MRAARRALSVVEVAAHRSYLGTLLSYGVDQILFESFGVAVFILVGVAHSGAALDGVALVGVSGQQAGRGGSVHDVLAGVGFHAYTAHLIKNINEHRPALVPSGGAA